MKRFIVEFEVNADMLTTVISVLSGHAGKLNVREVERVSNRTKGAAPVVNGYRGPSDTSPSWKIAKEYVAGLSKGDVVNRLQLEKLFKAAGYSEKSVSPMLTHLVRAGLVTEPAKRGESPRKA